MNLRFFALPIILGIAAAASAQSIIGTATNPANGHLYYLLSNSDWTHAESFAHSLNGNLATINDAAEQVFVYNTFSNFGGIGRTLWIGLNDQANHGTYVWSSGSNSSYRNWASGEPNNLGIEDYAAMWAPRYDNHSLWNNFANGPSYVRDGNTELLYGVVEVNAVPEPASFIAVAFGVVAVLRRRASSA